METLGEKLVEGLAEREIGRRDRHPGPDLHPSLAREQRLSALGALAAAAAHELGSPLSTIAVAAKELARDLPPDSPYADDVRLLVSQSQRCSGFAAGGGADQGQGPL